MSNQLVTYEPPGPVAKAFLESGAFIRGILGPIGSGKSVACIIELLRRAHLQVKGPDGLRHTRFAIVRNTFPELRTTTLKSWLDWMPASFGKLTMSSPITHLVVNDEISMEVIFLALDREEDVRKLMSLELTACFLNEARYITKAVLDGATGRVGRYPSVRDGGCTWAGIIMDTNPPDSESWWYKLAEGVDLEMVAQTAELERELRIKGLLRWDQPLMEFFRQPSGLSPEAENIQNLRPGYYQYASVGKTEDYVKVYVRGEYGFVVEGKPVYPMYRDNTHTAKLKIQPLPGVPILVGVDGGLTPAAVFAQRTLSGRWLILSEVVTEDCGVTRFGELLLAHKALNYPEHEIGGAWGDPAGTARGDDEEAWFTILNNVTGWSFKPAPTNDIDLRLEAVILPLNRLIDGLPAVQVSPDCATYRKGFISGYHYKLVKSSNGASVHETPAKNKYSHVHDAGQYLFLGGGEYEVALGRQDRRKPRMSIVAIGTGEDPFAPVPQAPKVVYSNEKTMRDWLDGRHKKKPAIALGVDDEAY